MAAKKAVRKAAGPQKQGNRSKVGRPATGPAAKPEALPPQPPAPRTPGNVPVRHPSSRGT